MSNLEALLRQADRVPAPDLWSDIERREPRRPPDHRLVAGVVALALAASGITLAATAFFGEREDQPAPRVPAADVDPRITAEIYVGQFPQEIAVGEGAVWVTVNENPPARWYVARIDPTSNEVTNEIEVPGAGDIAVGEGAVWVTGHPRRDPEVDPALYRIDPVTGEVQGEIQFPCGRYCNANQVAVGNGAVWVTLSTDYPDSGEVVRVDPATNQIVARITVPGDPRDLVVEGGTVWVYALGGGGSLHRIDARSNELVATLLHGQIPSGSGDSTPAILAVGHGYVWISAGDGDPMEVVRIDPATNEVVGDPVVLNEGLFQPFSTEAGGVWFRGDNAGNRPLIGRIDPTTLSVDESLQLDHTVISDGVIDSSTGTMWLTNHRRTVTRVDLYPDEPATLPEVRPRITAEIPVGQFPLEIAVGEGATWVTVNDARSPERWFVARIDPRTNRVTDEVEVREAADVAVGAGRSG